MICPNCNKEISDRAKFCSYCGTKIEQEKKIVSVVPEEEPINQQYYCKQCGSQVNAGNDLCDQCRKQEKEKKKSKGPMVVLGILFVALLAVGAFWGISFAKKCSIFSPEKKAEHSEKNTEDIGEEEFEEADDEDGEITIVSDDEEEFQEGEFDELEDDFDESEEGEVRDVFALAQFYNSNAAEYDGHAYAVFNYKEEDLYSYEDCKQFCEDIGGHLVVIDSEEENEFLYDYIKGEGLKIVFFGYCDEENEGDWQWVNGSESTYTNWANGQPNNGSKNEDGQAENYAEFYKDANDGTWNDAVFGMNTYRFVCEWE